MSLEDALDKEVERSEEKLEETKQEKESE